MMSLTLCCKRGMGMVMSLAVAILLLATNISAQSTIHGAIGGTVRDPSGAVIQGAKIETTSMETNAKASTTSDGNGRFVVTGLQPGTYSLEVSVSGFSTFKQGSIIVEVGRTTSIDVKMGIAEQRVTIEAVAESPVITTSSADITANINQVSINNLPINGRRWSTFAISTPGANPDGNFGLISFRGISGLLNNNTVDGGDNNQAFFAEEKGRTRLSYSMSAATIQEFQVNTSNYSAEYGRSAGGVVNAITKSGSNQYHGEAFWFYRSSDFAAFNPFQTIVKVVGGVNTTVPIKPADKRHQFGGALGGPIIKDKLFVFFTADQQLRNFPGVANASTPSAFFAPLSASEIATLTNPLQAVPALPVPAANGRGLTLAQANAGLAFLVGLTGVVPRTGDQLILFPKIDWKINAKNHFSVSYNRLRWNSPQGIQTQPVVFRGVESWGSDFVKGDTVVARLDTTFTPAVTNQFRFQFGRDFEFENSQPSIPGQPVSAAGVSPQITISGSAGIVFGKPDFLERRSYPDEQNVQFADTLSYARGTHFLKLGFDINRVHDKLSNLFQEGGAYSYNNRVDFISDYAARVNALANPTLCVGSVSGVATFVPCYSSFNQGTGPTTFRFRTIDLGFFVQDDWRITPKLTFNLGLRYEYQLLPGPQVPNPILPQTDVFPNDRNNFGPRVGVAFDITGRGKSVVRAGYGIYYGRIINSTISNAITNTGVTGAQLQFLFQPVTTGRPLYPDIVSSGTTVKPDVVVFGQNTQNPLIHQLDAVFEQEIFTNTMVSVSYIGSFGRHLPIFIDANLAPPLGLITYKIVNGPQNGQSFQMPLFTTARPNSNFGRITTISNIVKSKYDALVFQINRRMTKGLQFQTFYTYSKSNDGGQSSQTFTASNNVLNPFDLSLEQGRSNFDVRHRLGSSIVWEPEYFKNSKTLVRVLLDGWMLSPIVSISSGVPYTGSVSGNPPALTGFLTTGILGAGGSNRPPFIVRNAFQRPRIINVDLRAAKRFQIKESIKLELFGDFFNLFNHVNATGTGTRIYSTGGTAAAPTLTYDSTFGVVNSSSNFFIAQRQIQIGAKLRF